MMTDGVTGVAKSVSDFLGPNGQVYCAVGGAVLAGYAVFQITSVARKMQKITAAEEALKGVVARVNSAAADPAKLEGRILLNDLTMLREKESLQKVANLVFHGRPALYLAAQKDRPELIEGMKPYLSNHNPVDEKNNEMPIHIACRKGHARALGALLKDDQTDVNAVVKGNNTPLHICAGKGDLDCLKQLLAKSPSSLNAQNDNGMSPLMVAAKNGHAECVFELMKAPSIDFAVSDQKARNFVHYAAANGAVNVLKKIQETQPSLLVSKDGKEKTLHHIAAEGGQFFVAEYLLEQKIGDPNAFDKEGQAPLHVAIRKSFKGDQVARLYLASDKVQKVPTHALQSESLEELVVKADSPALMRFMKAKMDAGFTKCSEAGWTPVEWAAVHGCQQAMELLNEEGIFFALTDENKERLMRARKDLVLKEFEYLVTILSTLQGGELARFTSNLGIRIPALQSFLTENVESEGRAFVDQITDPTGPFAEKLALECAHALESLSLEQAQRKKGKSVPGQLGLALKGRELFTASVSAAARKKLVEAIERLRRDANLNPATFGPIVDSIMSHFSPQRLELPAEDEMNLHAMRHAAAGL